MTIDGLRTVAVAFEGRVRVWDARVRELELEPQLALCRVVHEAGQAGVGFVSCFEGRNEGVARPHLALHRTGGSSSMLG